MPTGMNQAWREFLQTEIADVTNGADVVLHQGDQIEGAGAETVTVVAFLAQSRRGKSGSEVLGSRGISTTRQ